MLNKYIITYKGKKDSVVIQVSFTESGGLHAFEFQNMDLNTDVRQFIIDRVPLHESGLDDIQFPHKVEPLPTDLSFPFFWETYAHKIGDKTRTLKLWTALTEADRITCIRAIPKYNNWLKMRPAMERLYPETFLKQERFRNEFKII